MKTQDVHQNSAVTTRRGRRADFLFVGLGVAPLALMLGGQPEMAILLFIPLMLAACLYGMWEQVESQGVPCHHSADSRKRHSVSPLSAAGVTLREQGEAGDRLGMAGDAHARPGHELGIVRPVADGDDLNFPGPGQSHEAHGASIQ